MGTLLAVDKATLDKISSKYSNTIRCKNEMFRAALKMNIVWKNVLDALCRLGYQSSVAKVCEVMEIQYDGVWSTGSEVSPIVWDGV